MVRNRIFAILNQRGIHKKSLIILFFLKMTDLLQDPWVFIFSLLLDGGISVSDNGEEHVEEDEEGQEDVQGEVDRSLRFSEYIKQLSNL